MRRFRHQADGLILAVIDGAGAPAMGRADVTDSPARVPVRGLALVTGLTCVVAQVLAQTGGAAAGAHDGPWSVVIGQAVWNAAQVGLLLLLLCLWCVGRRWWVASLAVATLACLPFAVYVISPGGWLLSALLLATCGLSWTRDVPNLSVSIVDAPPRGAPMLANFEFLALVCNLLCSIYNFNPSQGVPPYWNSMFKGVSDLTGFTTDLATIAQAMFSLGIKGVTLPAYIPVGSPCNNLGAIAFVLIWTVLPVLYVVYFALLAKQAKHSPGTRIQQALCAVAIVHFLFLTDFVDYRFGRGIVNPATHGFHWLEVYVWRLAILLPIYQKVMSGQWLRGHGKLGVAMHYGIGAWAVGFFVYEVLMYNSRWFYAWATGTEYNQIILFGRGYAEAVGWHGALVLMVLLYGYMVIAMRCNRIVAESAATETTRA